MCISTFFFPKSEYNSAFHAFYELNFMFIWGLRRWESLIVELWPMPLANITQFSKHLIFNFSLFWRHELSLKPKMNKIIISPYKLLSCSLKGWNVGLSMHKNLGLCLSLHILFVSVDYLLPYFLVPKYICKSRPFDML